MEFLQQLWDKLGSWWNNQISFYEIVDLVVQNNVVIFQNVWQFTSRCEIENHHMHFPIGLNPNPPTQGEKFIRLWDAPSLGGMMGSQLSNYPSRFKLDPKIKASNLQQPFLNC